MSNVSAVTSNFFPKSSENSATITLAATIAPGATTVPLSGATTNYNDGDVVVFTVDPGTALVQVFTGVMSAGNVINVVWTRGNNQTHSAGATVVDNITATHWNLAMKGILTGRDQTGALRAGSVPGTAIASGAIGTNHIATGAVTSAAIADGTVAYADLLGTIFGSQVQTYTNGGSFGGTFSYLNLGGVKLLWGVSLAQTVAPNGQTNFTLTLPSGFFNTVTTITLGSQPIASVGNVVLISNYSTTTITFIVKNLDNSNSGAAAHVLVIGT